MTPSEIGKALAKISVSNRKAKLGKDGFREHMRQLSIKRWSKRVNKAV